MADSTPLVASPGAAVKRNAAHSLVSNFKLAGEDAEPWLPSMCQRGSGAWWWC